jgi:hypothetical protein
MLCRSVIRLLHARDDQIDHLPHRPASAIYAPAVGVIQAMRHLPYSGTIFGICASNIDQSFQMFVSEIPYTLRAHAYGLHI